MKSPLARAAALALSVTLFSTYVYLQTTGRSVADLWRPASAEAGGPTIAMSPQAAAQIEMPPSAEPFMSTTTTKSAALPGTVQTGPLMSSSKDIPLPVIVDSKAIVRSLQAIETPPSNPVPAAFGAPSIAPAQTGASTAIMAGSKSLPMPVRVESGTLTIAASPTQVGPVQIDPNAKSGALPQAVPIRLPQMMSGSKSSVMPVQINPLEQAQSPVNVPTFKPTNPIADSAATSAPAIDTANPFGAPTSSAPTIMPGGYAPPNLPSAYGQTAPPQQQGIVVPPTVPSGGKTVVVGNPFSQSAGAPAPAGPPTTGPRVVAPQYPLFQGTPQPVQK